MAMACSIACSMRPSTRRAVSCVDSRTGLMTFSTSVSVKLAVVMPISELLRSESRTAATSSDGQSSTWPRMWAMKVALSWRNVTVPVRDKTRPRERSWDLSLDPFASLRSARLARASAK